MNYGIIQTLGFCQFCDAFSDSYKNNFTYEGKKALFDYLEQYAQDIGENVELDTIALCCEYTEYDSIKEVQDDYSDIKDLEDLQDYTTVIEVVNGHIIIQAY